MPKDTVVNEAWSIPCEIFHIKKSALRLGVWNINTITTGPFPLVHPPWYIQKAATEPLISISWKMGELSVHCFTCKPQNKPPWSSHTHKCSTRIICEGYQNKCLYCFVWVCRHTEKGIWDNRQHKKQCVSETIEHPLPWRGIWFRMVSWEYWQQRKLGWRLRCLNIKDALWKCVVAGPCEWSKKCL